MEFQESKSRIALVDGNSFYCSCELAMRPAYQGRPLVVLSNNDGCAIARTDEAKKLDIKMGAPWFQIKHLTRSHGLIGLSANFNLYGDLSQRMMNIIGQFSPKQEIYSIDESFLDLTGIAGTGRQIGQNIRHRVKKWIGIPTCVGIGSTHTLAKLANLLAKEIPRLQGVCDLSQLEPELLMRAIRHVPVNKVWGVGRHLSKALMNLGIYTAADLAQADNQLIKNKFSIVLAKTAKELSGESCLTWSDVALNKKRISYSRSFGHPVTDKMDLAQALSTFTVLAAEKLRQQQTKTSAVSVFISTSRFRDRPQYSGRTIYYLNHATHHTPTLNRAALNGLNQIYRSGFIYAKAGISLLDLDQTPSFIAQGRLFDTPDLLQEKAATQLMTAIDNINQKYGRHTISTASTVSSPHAPWHMRQERMTPAYTTSWDQVIEIWH